MTQKTGRFGASGREFCLYSLEKEDIEETEGEDIKNRNEKETAGNSCLFQMFFKLLLFQLTVGNFTEPDKPAER